MLCSINSFDKCKYIRHFAKVALNEKETNEQCYDKGLNIKNSSASTYTDVKSYDDIPGPKGIFGIGTFYNYFPVFGKL